MAHESVKGHKRSNYIAVGVVLAVLTMIEVGVTYFREIIPQVPTLLTFMAAKVVLVGLFYMHLRYDSRWFTAIILSPIPFIALALIILTVVGISPVTVAR